MFGRRSRAEKLKKEARNKALGSGLSLARNKALGSGLSLAGAFSGARPVAERLLYDDDLRDNIRTMLEAGRKIVNEFSDEDPTDVMSRLWDDPKLRREVEAAVGSAQEGFKRVRGQRVRSSGGGGSRRLLLILLVLAGGFLFLNPRTGPEARRIVGDIIGSLRSGS